MAPRKPASPKPKAAKPAATVTAGEIDASDVQLPAAGFETDGLFIFDARPIVTDWPAEIKYPIAGGKVAIAKIRLDLEYLTMDEVRDLDEQVADFLAKGGRPGGPGDPLAAKLHGWSGLGREGVGVVLVTDANRSLLMADVRIRQAVTVSLAKIAMGIEEKNSETPPDGGQPRAGANRETRRRLAKQIANGLKATG